MLRTSANDHHKDSLQAFSSSIAGLLSSRAVLSSVGVGDSTASPTAALLLSIFQESVGRVATILFAHRLGTALEPECKMYRLLADILNDIAFVLDCLSPGFSKPVRVIILSFSSLLRALCGVAAGSAKASLSAHFARWGNLGELNAKDSSQETVISLLGMLAGSLVVPMITTPMATWTALILLLSIHLETNRRAVRAVSMRTLNRQRATLVYYELLRNRVPTPQDISRHERIFERDGVLRSNTGSVIGHCTVGTSFKDLIKMLGRETRAHSRISTDVVPSLLKYYRSCGYVLWSDLKKYTNVWIVIKKESTSKDLLMAWWQALTLATKGTDGDDATTYSIEFAKQLLSKHQEALQRAGWDLRAGALETTTNRRFSLREQEQD